jgi:hypothetical protein
MTNINGFTIQSIRHQGKNRPIEDAYLVDDKNSVFAVADGVTRDVDPKTREYPRPSPAKIAADIFCSEFVYSLNHDPENKSKKDIRKAFEFANKSIDGWNKSCMPNPNYLDRDFAGCVAAGAIIRGNVLNFSYICDCGVAIVNSNGQITTRTKDEGPAVLDRVIWATDIMQGEKWENASARKKIRSLFRNKPLCPYGFGVLTGESNAINYVRTLKVNLARGDTIFLYTDGLEPILTQKRFPEIVASRNFDRLKDLAKEIVQSEGTLVYHLHQ